MFESRSKNKFLTYTQTVFLLVGMIIGAGIFALPAALARVGAILGTLLFLIISLAVLLVHVFYTEVIRVCGMKRRFVTDVARLLGRRFRLIAVLVTVSQYGALFAYMLLGGIFLQNMLVEFLPSLPLAGFQLIFLISSALLAFFGDKTMSTANWYATCGLIVVFGGIILLAGSALQSQNLLSIYPENFFSPFGVILFSLLGINAIPEMWASSNKESASDVRQAVIGGTLISALVTYLFAIAVLGVTGPYTTDDAIGGLAAIFGPKLLFAGSLAGFLAVFTSFIVMTMNLSETLRFDFKYKAWASFLLALLPVLGLWLFLPRDYLRVVSITGSIFGGLACILIALMYAKLLLKPPSEATLLRLPKIFPFIVALVFLSGIIFEVARFFS